MASSSAFASSTGTSSTSSSTTDPKTFIGKYLNFKPVLKEVDNFLLLVVAGAVEFCSQSDANPAVTEVLQIVELFLQEIGYALNVSDRKKVVGMIEWLPKLINDSVKNALETAQAQTQQAAIAAQAAAIAQAAAQAAIAQGVATPDSTSSSTAQGASSTGQSGTQGSASVNGTGVVLEIVDVNVDTTPGFSDLPKKKRGLLSRLFTKKSSNVVAANSTATGKKSKSKKNAAGAKATASANGETQ
jgi:hypothetical protein